MFISEVIFFYPTAAAAAKSLQSCPILCDPIDGSPPGSAVPGILQARALEWVAIAFSIIQLLPYKEEMFLDAALLFLNGHLTSSHELSVSIFLVLQAFFLSKLDGLFFLV